MGSLRTHPNPDLSVGPDNKQRWNQPAHRRHGFHNAHSLFRRTMMVRSRNVLALDPVSVAGINTPALDKLKDQAAFSAFVCAQDNKVLLEHAASDFSTRQPHSIQSVTKMHIHLIVGRLLEKGLLDLYKPVRDYLPDIGSGYATARVQDLLDMNVANDFSEDYDDPQSDCYAEEVALGWRLPETGTPEITLRDFTQAITGADLKNRTGHADYKSANTDVLTLICAAVSPVPLATQVEAVADAVGYEDAFHISLSRDGYPAFSGGGCVSARDLARFGLLFARSGRDIRGRPFANAAFLRTSLHRAAPALNPPRDWLRYSNHLMTDGRFLGHAGYGGQFLMVDTVARTACAFLSVLENDAGYDEGNMVSVILALREVCEAVARKQGLA